MKFCYKALACSILIFGGCTLTPTKPNRVQISEFREQTEIAPKEEVDTLRHYHTVSDLIHLKSILAYRFF